MRTGPFLPGPGGVAAYARSPAARGAGEALDTRMRLLVAQLAAVRSGCGYCTDYNRHVGLCAGVPAAALDAVRSYERAPHFSERERAALALADAVTDFAEAAGGFPAEILSRARAHFPEGQIMALVALVATEHFFDPATGALGRDAVSRRDWRGRVIPGRLPAGEGSGSSLGGASVPSIRSAPPDDGGHRH